MDGRNKNRKRTRALLRAIGRPGGRLATLSIALPLLSGLLLLAQAYVLADILHAAIVDGADIRRLLPEMLLLAGIFCLRSIISLLGDQAATLAAERIKTALRGKLFRQLVVEKVADDGTKSSGALAIALIEHVEQLQGYYARFRPAAVQAACLPLAFGMALLKFDIVVAALFLLTAPLIPLFMALAGWGAEAAMRDQAQSLTRLSGYFADRLRGIVTLTLFGRAQRETAAVEQAGDALRTSTLAVLKIAFLSSAVLEFFAALGVAGVALYVGLSYLGFLHISPGLSLRTGLFCLLMAPEVYQPLRLLAAHYHDKKSAESALEEIEAQSGVVDNAELVAAETEEESGAVAAETCGLKVTVSQLSLTTPAGRRVLRDIGLEMVPGEHATLVGESGAGKSSLLQAIARLRTIDGEIAIDGHALAAIPEAVLRRKVAILNQKPFLFRGTIADNLRLAGPHATDDELLRAGHMSSLFADTGDGSLRLDAMLGDNGAGLSGGQIQRLSLARIFLRDAGLLLLDEPTAHLDAATERLVLDALCSFAKGRTMLIATHSAAVIDRFPHVFHIGGAALTRTSNPVPKHPRANAA